MQNPHPMDIPFSELFERNTSIIPKPKIKMLENAGVKTPRDFVLSDEKMLRQMIGKGAFERVKQISFSLGGA